MISKLQIPGEQWEQMRAHVNSNAPLETCGLCAGKITGKDKRAEVEITLGIANQAHSTVRFVMDAHEQLRAFELIESKNMELLAIYHSHPAGPEMVSATDIAEAAYAVVHIVWSRKADEWQARGFWIDGRNVSEVSLQII